MRRIVLLALLALVVPVLAAAQDMAPGQKFGVDYQPAHLTQYQVTHLELQIDGSGYSNVGLPAGVTLPDTQANHQTHVIEPPAMTPGTHEARVRFCNASACSAPVSITFRLVMVPPAGAHGRVVTVP